MPHSTRITKTTIGPAMFDFDGEMDRRDDEAIVAQERRLGVEQKASINSPEKRMDLGSVPGLTGNSMGQQAVETNQTDTDTNFKNTVNAWRKPNPNSINMT